jgi:hypothetical protein
MSNSTREIVDAHEPELIRTSKRVRAHCACGWLSGRYATEERARLVHLQHADESAEETLLTAIEGCMRALCCECGQVRRFNIASATERDWMVGDLSRNDEWLRSLGAEAYWRMLRKLQCANCGTMTMHALIRDFEECADCAEREDREEAEAKWKELIAEQEKNARLAAQLDASLAMLDQLGIRFDCVETEEWYARIWRERGRGQETCFIDLAADLTLAEQVTYLAVAWRYLLPAVESRWLDPWARDDEDPEMEWKSFTWPRVKT